MRGFIKGDFFSEILNVNLPSFRTRFWGTNERKAVSNSFHLFVAGEDGTLYSLIIKALKNGCKELVFYIKKNDLF